MHKTLSCSWFVYLVVLVAAGALYAVSSAPGPLWQDSGLIQYRVWHNDVEGFLGLALSHPLYYLVAIGAKLVPIGTFAQRVNLVSAVAGAVAVANLYLVVRLWLGKQLPALVAALTLAVSHTFWRHASIAETYTLWTALFTGELVVLLQYDRTRRIGYLYALGLLNGLAIAVHMLAVIPAFCYAILATVLLGKKAIRWRQAALIGLCWMVGALPYECLIVKHLVQSGDVLATLGSAAFGDRWKGAVLNTQLARQIAKENLSLLVLNFPTPNLILFFVGLFALIKAQSMTLLRLFVAALMVLFFAFAFRYQVADRYAFFIPFYVLAATMIGLGAHTLSGGVRHKVWSALFIGFSFLPIAAYAMAPDLARQTSLFPPTRGDVPYRDDATYFLEPWKTGYNGAERFAREALETVPSDAIIYADTTTVAPLLYAQEVQGHRPEVWIITGLVRSAGAPAYGPKAFTEFFGNRSVYVTSNQPGYYPSFMIGKYEFVKNGVLWRVVQSSAPPG